MRQLQHSSNFVDRRPATALTPEYEDFGLFKTEILAVDVNLAPVFWRTSRNDLVIRGYTRTAQEFEVVFAGRRVAMAGALIARLDAVKAAFMRRARTAASDTDTLETQSLPVLVEGAWRRRYWVDQSGWQRHMNQLVAARWSLQGQNDTQLTFGQSPCHAGPGTLPVIGEWGSGEGTDGRKAARHN